VCERVCGLARLLRGYAQAGVENIALWHERDISHSSVERVALPDACIALDYMLDRMRWVVEGLVVHPDRMRANLDASLGLVFSQGVLTALLDRSELQREEAYALVQQSALRAWAEKRPLLELLESDARVGAVLSSSEIEACFDPARYVGNAGVVFERLEAL
jgi:adenylosuccinate lyase